jgi:hypothetical protein
MLAKLTNLRTGRFTLTNGRPSHLLTEAFLADVRPDDVVVFAVSLPAPPVSRESMTFRPVEWVEMLRLTGAQLPVKNQLTKEGLT